jgi:hypothetical protein
LTGIAAEASERNGSSDASLPKRLHHFLQRVRRLDKADGRQRGLERLGRELELLRELVVTACRNAECDHYAFR